MEPPTHGHASRIRPFSIHAFSPQCLENSYTAAAGSSSERQCLVLPGYGWDDGGVNPCQYGAAASHVGLGVPTPLNARVCVGGGKPQASGLGHYGSRQISIAPPPTLSCRIPAPLPTCAVFPRLLQPWVRNAAARALGFVWGLGLDMVRGRAAGRMPAPARQRERA
jgi:hypothetical protein